MNAFLRSGNFLITFHLFQKATCLRLQTNSFYGVNIFLRWLMPHSLSA